MSKPLFTSDLHFFHKNVIKYCGRPWTYEKQTEELIDRWNSKVGKLDTIYHLGDFTFAGKKKLKAVLEIIQQLNGQISFLRGNHCNESLWRIVEEQGLSNVVEVCDYKEIKVGNQNIVMCHYPFETWNRAHHGSWHLHGHCHGSLPAVGKRLDVGIDNHPEHQIFSFEEVEAHMAKQPFVVKDHHREGQE